MDLLESYFRRIIEANSVELLNKLKDKALNDPSLSNEDLSSIILLIEDKVSLFDGTDKRNALNNDISYGEYDVEDYDYLEPCQELWKDSNYIEWLDNVLFERFFHIPNLDIQKKLLMTIIFINSKAVPKNVALPHFYFLSNKPNSGKSTFAKYIAKHYLDQAFIYIAEDTSGGSLRNSFDEVYRSKQPSYALIDNFHPTLTVQRLGAFYGRLLKYTREESIVSIAQPATKELITFNTFCLKVFTSIFPLDHKVEELASRCLVLSFETSPRSLDDLDQYNWSYLKNEYFKIWGDTNKVSKSLTKLLRDLSKHKTDKIINRRWQLVKYLIAVGMFIGLFKDIESAIDYYSLYFEWSDGVLKNKNNSSLYLTLYEFVNKIHPIQVTKNKQLYKEESDLDYNEIGFDRLFRFLSNSLPVNRTLTLEREVADIMRTFGWRTKVITNYRGDKVDISFVRD